MGRVLRIGAGLMGVLLVVMTAGLWFRRATTEPLELWVFTENDYPNPRYVSRVPGTDFRQPVTDKWFSENIGYRFEGWSADREWIYFQSNWFGYDTEEGPGAILYRVRPTGRELEIVARNVTYLEWSPDRSWLAITTALTGEESGLYRINPDGSGRELLLKDSVSTEYGGFLKPIISPNGNQIAIEISFANYFGPGEIHLVDVRRKTSTQVFRLPPLFHLNDWSPDGEWFILGVKRQYRADRLYRVRVDGTGFAVLTDETRFGYGGSLSSWLPNGQGVVLFYVDYMASRAVSLEDGHTLWRLEDGRLLSLGNSVNGHQSLIWVEDHHIFYQVNPVDGTLTELFRIPTNSSVLRWSDDGQWIWYTHRVIPGLQTIVKMRTDGSSRQLLATFPIIDSVYPAWTSDNRGLIFHVSDVTGQNLTTYRIREDGSGLQPIVPNNSGYMIFVGDAAPINAKWRPEILLTIGISFFSLCFGWKRRRPAA